MREYFLIDNLIGTILGSLFCLFFIPYQVVIVLCISGIIFHSLFYLSYRFLIKPFKEKQQEKIDSFLLDNFKSNTEDLEGEIFRTGTQPKSLNKDRSLIRDYCNKLIRKYNIKK